MKEEGKDFLHILEKNWSLFRWIEPKGADVFFIDLLNK
jgi:hypothetical protein